jgi:diguanylate cyclase (GGDEF)-like protein
LAHHDPLTGLANRILLEDRLTHAINNAARTGKSVGVIFCDLNEFKSINDDFGHLVGDQVLQVMSKRIKSVCRANDTVARFGGDEFMIIVEQLNTASELNQLIEVLTKKIAEPIEDMGFSLSASIGVATFPSDGMTKNQLIDIADKNMYRKKIQFHGIE